MPITEPSMTQAEVRGRGIAAIVRQYDELKAELDKLTTTYTIHEIADDLDGLGFTPKGCWLSKLIYDYAWNHPDWFIGGSMTPEGARHVRLDPEVGLVFTVFGRDAIRAQYV